MDGVKRVSILGSTGSIGQSTVDLLLSRSEKFSVQALTCRRNVTLLAEQAKKLKAKRAVVADESLYGALKDILSGSGVETAAGEEAVMEAAAMPCDWTMAAIVGMAGLEPVLQAVGQGRIVAIANKEPLVSAGPFILEAARQSGAMLLPVDSEHNAIFQVFDHDRPEGIEKIILTASGGPFLNTPIEKLAAVTPAQAVAHPNWSMGAKISVDSATMMNKALEVIEAHYLFNVLPENIDVLVHPQSIIHSMVCYRDGSVLAQMGAPDMRTPIAHALSWPDRMETTGRKLDLTKPMKFDFQPVDKKIFSAIPLAYDCLKKGLWACIAMNAANEALVQAFLDGKLGYLDIVRGVRAAVEAAQPRQFSSVQDVISYDKTVRAAADAAIGDHSGARKATAS